MSDSTHIEWTDATWNPVTGCTRVSPGCANCYIERTPPFRMAGRRFEMVGGESTTGVTLHADRLDAPLHWRKPRRVFVCSLADLFHDDVPEHFIQDVFETMARAPQHTFQVLTKRPERALEILGTREQHYPSFCELISWATGGLRGSRDILPPNIWLGVSIENARYTWRADVLREIPAAVRFISAEPLLGSLFPSSDALPDRPDPQLVSDPADRAELERRLDARGRNRAPLDLTGIDWVIVGGESGPGARSFHLEHAREIIARRALMAGAVEPLPTIFVKQLGAKPVEDLGARDGCGVPVLLDLVLRDRKGGDMAEWPADLRIREFPSASRRRNAEAASPTRGKAS